MARCCCVKAKKQTECVQPSGYKTAKNCKKLITRKSKRRRVILMMVLMKYGMPISFSWINFQHGTKDSNIY